jgi:hypothetical protein
MTSIPGPRTPPRPISNLLGTRPMNYRFDIADFLVYQTICDSVLRSNPSCRAALCMGGIVARLVDCPRAGPGRPSAVFTGPGPGPRGPVHPQLALARGQHWPGPQGPVRLGPGPTLALHLNKNFLR